MIVTGNEDTSFETNLPPHTLPPTPCARPNMDRFDICAHNQRAPPMDSELVKGAAMHMNRHEGLQAHVPRVQV